MKKLLLIYNPHAGKGQIRGKLADILDVFTQNGWLVSAYPTQCPGDGAEQAKQLARGFDRVAVCGGDGTLHEVITGLLELPEGERPVVGYLPSGTTNDFARNLSLPKEMEEMARTAVTGTPRPIDLGRFDQRYFIYVAAFGAFTDVSYNTSQQFKNMFGHLAYVLKGVTELKNLKGYRLRIEYDGGALEGEYLYGMVSNTISVGGLIGLPKDDVTLDDGLLEAVLVERPRTVAQLNAIILGLARQEYSEQSGIVGLHSSRFRITSEEPIPFTLDGEYGGEHRRAEVTAVERPIQVVYGTGSL